LDFGVKSLIFQFYAIKNNTKLNHWSELKLHQKIPKVFFYIEVNFRPIGVQYDLAIKVKTSLLFTSF
jgi:hypothetical protein